MAQLASPPTFMSSAAGQELTGRVGNPKSLPSNLKKPPASQPSKALKNTDSQGDDEIDFMQALALPKDQLFAACSNQAKPTTPRVPPLTAPSTDPTRQKTKMGEDISKRITLREALELERENGPASSPASPSGSSRKQARSVNRVASPAPKPDTSAPPSLTARLLGGGGRIGSFSIDGWEDPENLKRITLHQALQDDPTHISIHRALKEPLVPVNSVKNTQIDPDDPEYRKPLTLQEALKDDPTHISLHQALSELPLPTQFTPAPVSPGRSPTLVKSPILGQSNASALMRRNTESAPQPGNRRASAQLARTPRRATTNDTDRNGWVPPSESVVSAGRPGQLPAVQTLPAKMPVQQQKKGDTQFQYMEMWNALQRELRSKPPSTVWRKAARMTFEIIDDEQQLHEFSGKSLVVWLLRYLRSCDYFVLRNIEITYEKAKMLSATLLDRRAIRPVRSPLDQPFSVSGTYCVTQHYNEWLARKREKNSAAKSLSQTSVAGNAVQEPEKKLESVQAGSRAEVVAGPTWVEAQRAKDKSKPSRSAQSPASPRNSLTSVKALQQPTSTRSPTNSFSLPTSSLPPNFAKYTNTVDDMSLSAPTNIGFLSGSMDVFPSVQSKLDDEFGPSFPETKDDLFSARRQHAKKWNQLKRVQATNSKEDVDAEGCGEILTNGERDGENGNNESNSAAALECVNAETSFVDIEPSIEGNGAINEDSIISLTPSEMDMSQQAEAEQRKMDEIEAEIAEEVKREEEEEKANALAHVESQRRGSVASLPGSLDELPVRRFSYGQGATAMVRLQRKMAVADIEEIVGVFEFLADQTPHETAPAHPQASSVPDPMDDPPSTPTSILSTDLSLSETPTPTQTPNPERDTKEVARIEKEPEIHEEAEVEVVRANFEEKSSIEETTNEGHEVNEVDDFHSDDWKAVDDLLSSLTSDLLEASGQTI